MFLESIYKLDAINLFRYYYGTLFCVFSFLAIITYKILIMWKTFKKSGKNGWEAIIPIYRAWTLFEISGYPGYLSLFIFIPWVGSIVLLIYKLLAALSLSKKYKESDVFAIFLLWLLPTIGYSIIAFGKAEYHEEEGEQKNISVPVYARKNDDENNEDDDRDIIYCKYCSAKNYADNKKCKNCKKEL